MPLVASSRFVCLISRGEPGEGGELERVVMDDRFMENRRELLVRGGPLEVGWDVADVTEGAESVIAEPLGATCEVVRRKMLDMVRLKLEVEPRVVRRERGVPVEAPSSSAGVGVEGVVAEGRREARAASRGKEALMGADCVELRPVW